MQILILLQSKKHEDLSDILGLKNFSQNISFQIALIQIILGSMSKNSQASVISFLIFSLLSFAKLSLPHLLD